MQSKTKVCVVGAGPAGLCAAKHLLEKQEKFDVTVFEQSGDLGGIWRYNDLSGTDVHSGLYLGLKTIIPKECMCYYDFPYDKRIEASFIPHEQVLTYFHRYAAAFNLLPFIKFNSKVVHVQKGAGETFMVNVQNVHASNECFTQEFDVIICANGHYTVPNYPEIENLGNFRGLVMHSHEYRRADQFTGKMVAIVGANTSGCDIAIQISNFATKVFLCHRSSPISSQLPVNVTQTAVILRAGKNGRELELANGEIIEADAIIFCTGYLYSFPFLSKEFQLRNENERLMPLFLHMIHIDYPKQLFFLGLPKMVSTCLVLDYQMKVIVKTLLGEVELPEKAEMLKYEENEFEKRLALGMRPCDAHKMGDLQFPYLDDLAEFGKIPEVPLAVREIYNDMLKWRSIHLLEYRKTRYYMKNDNEWSKCTDFDSDYDYKDIITILTNFQ